MTITRDTQVCISIAERPGNLGATTFNNAFQKLDMNFIYKPFRVEEKDLEGAIIAIKTLGIRGCGVSMPHKMKVMDYLDQIDDSAKKIGAINTIVNEDGKLYGYNTDSEGVRLLLKDFQGLKQDTAVVLGAGGAARAIIQALKDNKAKDIIVMSRDFSQSQKLAVHFEVSALEWSERESVSGSLLINATPVGMKAEDEDIITDALIQKFEAIMDVVVVPFDTSLIRRAKGIGKQVFPGTAMASLQGMVQFKLYTEKEIPQELIEEGIEKFLKS